MPKENPEIPDLLQIAIINADAEDATEEYVFGE